MARIKKQKIVHKPPVYQTFKPVGTNRNNLKKIALEIDEFESIRLADYLSLDHAEAAEEMGISRSTFSRLVEKARNKMAIFLIEGKEINIEGGNIHFRNNIIQCNSCGHRFNIRIEKSLHHCPECLSDKLLNIAGGFGHGKCCSLKKNKQKLK